MKTKRYLLVLLLPLALLISGCGEKKVTDREVNDNGNKMAIEKKSDAKNVEVPEDVNKEELFTSSPDGMLRMGKAFQCTFTYQDQNNKPKTGEYFVDGKNGKFRTEMDFQDEQTGKISKTHMIADKMYLYSWDDSNMTPAMKITMSTSTASTTKEAAAQEAELEQSTTYKCRSWNVDSSKFELPSGVNFMTFEELMNSYKVPQR